MALPNIEFLLECSEQTLSDLYLSSLDRSAKAMKRAKMELAEAVAERETAGIVQWLRDNRAELLAVRKQKEDVIKMKEDLDLPQTAEKTVPLRKRA